MMMMNKFLVTLCLVAAISIGTGLPGAAHYHPADTTLPFQLADEKRLSDEDLEEKPEGWYLTGLPSVSLHPIRGLGIGGHAFLFDNSTKEDPFFYYTPYRSRYSIEFNYTTSGRISGGLGVDIPYIFNTPWRLRGELIFADDPNFQYWGIGEGTLDRLSFINKRTGEEVENARFADYEDNLALTRPGIPAFGEAPIVTDMYFDEVQYTQFLAAIAIERTFLEGRLRVMAGFEYLYIGINHYDNLVIDNAIDISTGNEVAVPHGRTRITRDRDEGKWDAFNVAGYDGGHITLMQSGIMYDTRDFEPDPNTGEFAEFSFEFSAPFIGSEFTFIKASTQAMFFRKLFPDFFKEMVGAVRFAGGYIGGSSVPFTEFMDVWTSVVGGIPALGGPFSLRGFRESRFVAPITGFLNAEVRWRLAEGKIFDQHLRFGVVPFVDIGTVANSFDRLSLNNMRTSYGAGLRLAWNQATIFRLDYALSKEDAQLFFMVNQTF